MVFLTFLGKVTEGRIFCAMDSPINPNLISITT